MTVASPVFRRPSRAALLDGTERVFILMLYSFLVWRFVGGLFETPANALFLVSEGLIAAFVLFRRPTEAITLRYRDWITGVVGTALPMMLQPTGGGMAGGAVMLLVGVCIAIVAKLSLRRSFGVVAANRGVKRSGLYTAVRHPMYLGYLLANSGVLLLNPSVWNAGLLFVWFGMIVARIHAEERILGQDPAYRDFAADVRFRLVPRIW